MVLLNLGINGDEETILEAKKRFENHVNGNLIGPDLRLAVKKLIFFKFSNYLPLVFIIFQKVFVSVLVEADESTFDKFIDIYKSSRMEEEKMRILNALCAVKNEDLIRKLLGFSFSVNFLKNKNTMPIKNFVSKIFNSLKLKPFVRPQDFTFVVGTVSSNLSTKSSNRLAWEFVKENWNVISARLPGFILPSVFTVKCFLSCKLCNLKRNIKST